MTDTFERGTTARLSFANFTRKLSSFRNKEYNKVEDLYDTRIPLHNEDVFEHGLRFKSKYIGSLEIARPTCKVDIITAMRRIRYEYKVKGIRKSRCYIEVSTSGVKISKRKSKRRRKQYTEEQLFIMQHPIYRIFYVSHDSQDLKIFSYITREVPNNTFRCNVFKAYKKNMALHIVRSLGQAFDVCHKLNPKPKKKKEADKTSEDKTTESVGEDIKDKDEQEAGEDTVAKTPEAWKQFNTDLDTAMGDLSLDKESTATKKADTSEMSLGAELGFDPFAIVPPPVGGEQFQPLTNGGTLTVDPFSTGVLLGDSVAVTHPPLTVSNTTSLPDFPAGVDPSKIHIPSAHLAYISRPYQQQSSQTITENPFTEHGLPRNESPISIGESLDGAHHSRKKSNPFRPGEEGTGTQQFTTQVTLLQEQLKAETAARIESQARVEQLLSQNQELLSQLQKLMTQLTQLQVLNLTQATSGAPPPNAPSADKKPASTYTILSTSPLDDRHASTSSSSLSPSPDLPTVVDSGKEELSPIIEGAVTESETIVEIETETKPTPLTAKVDTVILPSPPATNDPFAPQSTDTAQEALS